MRVLFTSSAGQGHLQPLLPLVRAFESRGHEVLTIAPTSVAGTLIENKVNHRLGQEPSSEDSDRVWSLFPSLSRSDASRLVEREWFAQLCLNALLPSVANAVRDWRPDLVVRETCEYAGAVVADRFGVPHAQVGVSTAVAESSVLNDLVKPDLEIFSRGLTARIHEAPYVTKFPASLDPSPYPTTFRYRNLETKTPKTLTDWWAGDTSPLVYLTFGTVATGVESFKELLRSIVSSLRGLDVRILVTTGLKMLPMISVMRQRTCTSNRGSTK
jgi:UDP:flavonoid glycosyltransferase YjiC (YdhE family)